jgi:1,4-dihydroxy-2-naphthoyl-CoA synthase
MKVANTFLKLTFNNNVKAASGCQSFSIGCLVLYYMEAFLEI